MYCIETGSLQQCKNCQLIEGKLYVGSYAFPNCPGTKWVQVASYPGTNNTPVYQVVNTPLDDFVPLLAVTMVLVTFRKRLKWQYLTFTA